MENEQLTLTDLIDAKLLQKLQDAFSTVTGMAALTTDKNGKAVTKGSNFSDFCMKLTRTNDEGRRCCEECDRKGAHLAIEKGASCAYYCHAGLVDFAAPIMANGEMVGSFIGGQVLTSPPDLEKFAKIADKLGIDREEYIEAVKKVKIVKKQVIENAAKFLHVIANIISDITYNGWRLYQSSIEIEKSAQAKSDFLANMSHEIRTPMNAVLGMTEMALREEMTPAARECLHQIRGAGKTLLVIINDILDFSKIESGKMDIVPVTYEPLSVVNDVASVVNSRIGDKDIEFTMDISPDIPNKLMGDNIRLQQILTNLLNNAVKFTKQGHVHLKVYCEKLGEEKVLIKASISDTGRGIKPEDMDKLFISFQQVDSKRNRNIEGTGLGLVICQSLLSLMGGSISVESEYGKGSVFSLELPQDLVSDPIPLPKPKKPLTIALLVENPYVRKQLEADLDRIGAAYIDIEKARDIKKKCDFFIVEKPLFSDNLKRYFPENSDTKWILIDEFNGESIKQQPNLRVIRKPVYYINLYYALGLINKHTRDGSLAEENFMFTAPDAKVLIVDDNHVNLTVAKGLIQPLKMQVDTATSAAQTIEKINEANFVYDIIFMDHMMPEVDGVETTHIIRRLMTNYSNVPIIALTANAVEGTREMFIKEGMNDFVAKPIDVKDIISKIRKWLPLEKIIPDHKDDEEQEELPLPKVDGLNVKRAVSLLGSEELFETVLRDYYNNIDKKSQAIINYKNSERWRDYTIEVHALKSTSKQIGADELSASAAELEKAGNDNNIDLINEKTDDLLAEYQSYKKKIARSFPEWARTTEVKKKIDPETILQQLDELREALDDYDTLKIDEAVENLSGLEHDKKLEPMFQNLKMAADESDVDLCGQILEYIRTAVEKQLTS